MRLDEAATELLSVTVDGTEHTYDATVDTNHDGVDDTVHVDTDHGSYEYTDTDGDGVADSLTQFDPDGHITSQAVFDAPTGNWDATTAGTGAPTIDSDGDGVPDTAVTHAADGSTVLATDTNGDGVPDVVTEISTSGDFTTHEHASDGAWAEDNHGSLAEAAVPATHAVIDPATGGWIRI